MPGYDRGNSPLPNTERISNVRESGTGVVRSYSSPCDRARRVTEPTAAHWHIRDSVRRCSHTLAPFGHRRRRPAPYAFYCQAQNSVPTLVRSDVDFSRNSFDFVCRASSFPPLLR
jgi:hypothetical protein